MLMDTGMVPEADVVVPTQPQRDGRKDESGNHTNVTSGPFIKWGGREGGKKVRR